MDSGSEDARLGDLRHLVERNVDVGQTVTASMSTPQLFLIANDLEQMQILASVDESDIGAIHDGQA